MPQCVQSAWAISLTFCLPSVSLGWRQRMRRHDPILVNESVHVSSPAADQASVEVMSNFRLDPSLGGWLEHLSLFAVRCDTWQAMGMTLAWWQRANRAEVGNEK
ncbi:hypothetical protein V8C37DRAFT_384480 [Trichoderma ceciliae]